MIEAIAHYQILSKLGAGGMGEVYLARDTKLGRKVAIKLLKQEFASRTDRLARFVREAKAASALNHPNIITVYEIGEFEGAHFIAVEHVEGQTLRQRMAEGRFTLTETLTIAIQIAEALTAAHDAGIVHRDIKPENIMVRPDGYVKILDFGIAKLSETAESDDDERTRLMVNTSPGDIMGTATYMSPEQARGKDVDPRSDIFSFGVVIYEMLTGKPPFTGETAIDVVAAVINTEPLPLAALTANLPHEILRIVNKTLRKKRDQRYHSTHDLLNDLIDLRDELRRGSGIESGVKSGTKLSITSHYSAFSGKDPLLLTDIENKTDDPIFDQTLKTALAFSLAQSPYLDIVPDAKVSQTLRLMGRTPDTPVTRELGEEICMRLNVKAFLTGTIASFGTNYIVTLEAVSARTGESIGREFEQAATREEVLNALSRAATGMREKLGESLASIEKFNRVGDYTTSSLQALKLFCLGVEEHKRGGGLTSIPFCEKAIEIDPDFASAYLAIAVAYRNANQWKQAIAPMLKAYELRDKVSEREKLRIDYFYTQFVTGEMDKGIDAAELWRKTYPSTSAPLIVLSDSYERLGQSQKAVDVAYEGLAFDPHVVLYSNLAESLLSLGRLSELKEICRQAFERGFDGFEFHAMLFQTAFIENDAASMAEHIKWFDGRKNEYVALGLQAAAAAFMGRTGESAELSRRGIDLALRSDSREIAAIYSAEQALRIVFWASGTGMPQQDRHLAANISSLLADFLDLEMGKEAVSRVSLAMALAGLTQEASSLADELHAERPKDTLLNELWLPMVRAAVELQNGNVAEAICELEVAMRFEKAAEFYPQFLRGISFLQLGKTDEAVREFDKILDHRGEAPLSSLYPLAQLGKARALNDESEYEKFFHYWKDADHDIPA